MSTATRTCKRCPEPAVARVQVKTSSGRVAIDEELCGAHRDQESRTGAIGVATVDILPLPEPAASHPHAATIEAGLRWLFETKQPDDAIQGPHGVSSPADGNRVYGFVPHGPSTGPLGTLRGASIITVKVAKPEYNTTHGDDWKLTNPITAADMAMLGHFLAGRGHAVVDSWNGSGCETGSVSIAAEPHPSLRAAYGRYRDGCTVHPDKGVFCRCDEWHAGLRRAIKPTWPSSTPSATPDPDAAYRDAWNAVLHAVETALTDDQKREILSHYPRHVAGGAGVADIIDGIRDNDAHLEWTEPPYESGGAPGIVEGLVAEGYTRNTATAATVAAVIARAALTRGVPHANDIAQLAAAIAVRTEDADPPEPKSGRLWWHAYGALVNMITEQPDREPGVWMFVMAGEAEVGPDGARDNGQAVTDPLDSNYGPLAYLGSWDHDPTEAEQRAVIPLWAHDEDCDCGEQHPDEAPTSKHELRGAAADLDGMLRGWIHQDGSPCPVFLAGKPQPKDGTKWWCTEHQQAVRLPLAVTDEMVAAFGEAWDEADTGEQLPGMRRRAGLAAVLAMIEPPTEPNRASPRQRAEAHGISVSPVAEEQVAILTNEPWPTDADVPGELATRALTDPEARAVRQAAFAAAKPCARPEDIYKQLDGIIDAVLDAVETVRGERGGFSADPVLTSGELGELTGLLFAELCSAAPGRYRFVELVKKLADERTRLAWLVDRLDAARVAADVEVAGYRSRLAATNRAAIEQSRKRDELEAEAERYRDELEQVRAARDDAVQALAARTDEVTALEGNLATLEGRAAVLEADLAIARANNELAAGGGS